MNRVCPICGGEDLTRETKEQVIPLDFGRDISIEATVYSCADCGMEGDLFDENEYKIENALADAQEHMAAMTIDDLAEQEISMAYFERAMSLPTRTLARWKRGEVTASGAALLKTVKTYPWILEVAEKRFEPTFAAERMVTAAMDQLGPALQGYFHKNGIEAMPVNASNGNVGFVGMLLKETAEANTSLPVNFYKQTSETS